MGVSNDKNLQTIRNSTHRKFPIFWLTYWLIMV